MKKPLIGVKNKVVILTGGMGLLGRTYTKDFAENEAKINVLDILPEEKAKKILEQILDKKDKERVKYYKVDISDKKALENVREDILKRESRIDVLINNAAVNPKVEDNSGGADTFENFSVDRLNKEIKVNITGAVICSQVFGGIMEKGGSIINISSTYGVVGPDQRIYPKGFTKPVSYSVTKGAIISLTKYLASYWGFKGIRVNCIIFGGVEANQDKKFLDAYSQRTPLGRMAKNGEYSGILFYLSSDSSSYATGGVFTVDGGWTAW